MMDPQASTRFRLGLGLVRVGLRGNKQGAGRLRTDNAGRKGGTRIEKEGVKQSGTSVFVVVLIEDGLKDGRE